MYVKIRDSSIKRVKNWKKFVVKCFFLILGARPARSSLRDTEVPPSALEEGGGACGHEQDGGAQPRHRVRAHARTHSR